MRWGGVGGAQRQGASAACCMPVCEPRAELCSSAASHQHTQEELASAGLIFQQRQETAPLAPQVRPPDVAQGAAGKAAAPAAGPAAAMRQEL